MWILGLGFVIGIMLGSLVDCIASRANTNKTFWGRSYCDKCHKTLAWYDLFPIFSYLFLRGHCRYCHKKLGLEYLLMELLTGVLVALLFLIYFPPNYFQLLPGWMILNAVQLLFGVFTICILLSVFITDLKTGLIPNRITYPATIIAFFGLLIISGLKVLLLYQSMQSDTLGKLLLQYSPSFFQGRALDSMNIFINGVLGAVVIGGFFLLLIIVTRGRGMGGGDLKLGIFIGLAIGFPQALLAILLGFILGSIVGIVLLLIRKKSFGQTIPFGPFMSLGAIMTLFWGPKILSWYTHIFSLNGSIF